MVMKTMNLNRRDAEKELMQALSASTSGNRPAEICPTPKLLRSFFAGAVAEERVQTQILSHLSECAICRRMMSELRKRRLRLRWAARLVAAVILIAAVVWTWPKHNGPVNNGQQIAVVDFGGSAVTRGVEDLPITVSHLTKRLRIVLSAENAAGSYEVKLVAPQAKDSPILATTGTTRVVDAKEELNLSLDLEAVPPGPYLLAIRHGKSDWVYRTLLIESR
jgi:hypothetical protein